MEEKGSSQMTISGLDVKWQITVMLAVMKSGTLLHPQVIYAGKTDRCLPKGVSSPNGWDWTFTDTHWSTEDSMLRYVDKIILLYVSGVRCSLPLAQCNQRAVALFDIYKAHQSPSLLRKLQENIITPLFVPAVCTNRLQPLDLTVNHEYKRTLKACFH